MPLSGIADADAMPAPPNTVRMRMKGATKIEEERVGEGEEVI